MKTAISAEAHSELMPNFRTGDLNSNELLEGKQGSPGNYLAALYTSDTEYAVPRHHHNFEQVRYYITGEVRYGEKIAPAGWVAYFPEGAFYGPQVRTLGSYALTVQFGGPSRNGFVSRPEFNAASDALKKRGEFEKGSFTWLDESGKRHRQDSFEAIFEQATGRSVSYPEPRYNDIILMNPANYNWIPDAKNPGIAHKWLGTFTEAETRVGFIHVDAGVTLNAGGYESDTVLFLTSGTVEQGGRKFPRHSAFGFDAKEPAQQIKALETSEFFVLHLPKL